jgi:hypothetical protein
MAQKATAAASIPSKANVTLSVRDFGATGNGTTKDTTAIQQTIDRCWALGGGDALVPAGNYLTGAIALKSNTSLRLERHAAGWRHASFNHPSLTSLDYDPRDPSTVYVTAGDGIIDRKLQRIKIREKEPELDGAQVRFAIESSEALAKALSLDGLAALHRRTGNRVASLRIPLCFYRRANPGLSFIDE